MDKFKKIFSPEDEQEMKQAFKEIIIEQFKLDIQDSGEYLVDMSEVEDMIMDSFRDIIDELMTEKRKEIKDKIDKLITTKLD